MTRSYSILRTKVKKSVIHRPHLFKGISTVAKNRLIQEKILSAKNHYEQVIDAIQDGLCVVDNDCIILSCNKLFAQRVRMPLAEIKGKDCRKIISRYDNNLFHKFCANPCLDSCIIKKTLEQSEPLEEIIKNIDKPGQAHYHKINTFPAKDSANKIYQTVIIIRDITAQIFAEDEVHRLSKLNQRILDSAPISIVVLDGAGKIVAANKHAKNLMDSRDHPIIGARLVATPEITANKYLRGQYKKLLKIGESFYYDNLSYKSNKNNEEKFFNIIAVPLFDQNNLVEGAISMALDNTEAVRAKQKLEELNHNLEGKVLERTRQLDIVNKKLNKALELKSKFIADASHELRTPLTVVQGNLDLAIKETQNNNCLIPEAYNLIAQEVGKMRSILTDLTVLTNIDSDNEQILYEKVNLGQLVKSVGQSLKILADQKKVAMIYKKGAKNIFIMGDEAKLEKLLLNIARNAIRYSNRKGKVKIWTEKLPHEALIMVEDNGIGIPAKDLPYIFERFYRVDKSRSREEGGTGIGLSIAKWIAEAHFGRISVQSTLGKGAKFIIHLPHDYKKMKEDSALF